jgi:hypothetical protein
MKWVTKLVSTAARSIKNRLQKSRERNYFLPVFELCA